MIGAPRLFCVFGALMGAAGVAATAVGAHGASSGLGQAGLLLLTHGAALLGGAVALGVGLVPRRLGTLALALLVIGPVLFAADMLARRLLGHSLFPMAAPAGGLTALAGWTLVGVATLLGRGGRA